ncbi:MAG: Trk system potassium transporter TrkA [Bacteroidales bacterium]|nr:Trk system potassium transporter TrkA [Bacteroidales bacterium]
MRIFIAGAGAVGTHLARLFVQSDHEVILMDDDEEKLEAIDANLDLLTIRGTMTSLEDLRHADVSSSDLFIAVPPYPDMSILAAILAKKLGANTTVARVNNSEYLTPENIEYFHQLGIDELIYPEKLGAAEAIESLKMVGVRQLFESSDGKVLLAVVKVRDNAPIINIQFADLDPEKKKRYNIVAIYRDNETIIPHGNDQLMHGDIVYFITTHENLLLLMQDAGKGQYEVQNVMIVGGSRIGQLVAAQLQDKYNTKLIEIRREKSNRLANKLENTLIINGDGRNMQLLKDEGISKMQAFIAVTNSPEVNILACQLAKKMGVPKTVAEVENLDYIPLAEEIGIGTLINKKLIAASYIYRYTLNARVAYVKCLTNTNAEMIELVAQPGSKVTKAPIMKLGLPKDMNIGAIVRGDEVIIANGMTQIEQYDKVVLFVMQESIHKVEKLFT